LSASALKPCAHILLPVIGKELGKARRASCTFLAAAAAISAPAQAVEDCWPEVLEQSVVARMRDVADDLETRDKKSGMRGR
jgi:hypothetical protein